MSNARATRADRLHAIVAKVAPTVAAHLKATGQWLNGGSAYQITELSDGRRRVRVTTADGDTVSGIGSTLDEALVALEKKLGMEVANG